jgi:hypothetical protein
MSSTTDWEVAMAVIQHQLQRSGTHIPPKTRPVHYMTQMAA